MRILAVLLAALASGCSTAQGRVVRPNIILVMADDQGWGDMAYNGHALLKTPNFDAAAASGLRFDHFYAAAPVCSPTRASVLTGRHPNRMGVFKWGHSMRPQEVTLAEALRSVGYSTAHFGKWHLGSVRSGSPDNPGNNGFDEWLSAPNFYDNDAVMSHKGRAVQAHGESSFIAVDAALAWMQQQTTTAGPSLAVIWFGSPHVPHRAAVEDRELYADQPQALQNFYGEISGMDRAFGKLRQGIADLGMRDDTLLWYCSDNGALPDVGDSGAARGRKGQLYDGGLRVPAFIEWPARIEHPRTTDLRCSTSDIYPTLLEVAAVAVAHQPVLDGVSLAALFDGSKPAHAIGFWDYPAAGVGTHAAKLLGELLEVQARGEDLAPPERSQNAAELPRPPHAHDDFAGHAAWLAGGWKLHRIEAQNSVRFELYNLTQDPAETDDRAASEVERVAALSAQLEAWQQSVLRSLNGDDY